MNWLDGLRKVLDAAPGSISFFFRNDDAGWDDARLFELLDLFKAYNASVDLAVIPAAISRDTAARLRRLVETDSEQVSLHQHGYAHLNYEPTGRKCEFGESRSREQQLADIRRGRDLLLDLFGLPIDPIFTPPWNRCSSTTIDCLRQLNMTCLSRDATAAPLRLEGLFELPVSIDWFARRQGVRLTLEEMGDALATAASRETPVGVMLHHAVMNDEERGKVGELLELLTTHSRARCVLMRKLVRPAMRGAIS